MRRSVPALAATLAALILAPAAFGATLDPIGEFDHPVYVTSEPGDAGRLYVVEQPGRIQLVTANGTTEFADLRDVVYPDNPDGLGEAGLLSIAFPPDFASSRLLYVFYTGTDASLHVGELKATGNTADPDSLRNVLTISHPNSNHNGGQLQFGSDGYLYVSTGDGGGGGDPGENSQDTTSLLGKILRIDPRETKGDPYSVPQDNPFAGAAPGRDEVWSYGLRNPWRFSFDRATGDLVIADVGQALWEEIDFATGEDPGKGLNYGWDDCEGRHGYEPGPASEPCATGVPPVFEYPHPTDNCASIAGGYVVRDPGLTELYGRYLFADSCMFWIRSIGLATPDALGERDEDLRTRSPVSFGEDACGRVYVVSLIGEVSRFVDGTPTDCSPVLPPPPPPEQGRCGPVVRGGDGDDDLRGGAGAQDLLGLAGSDKLRGDDGDDCVDGGAGKDRVKGGDGRDALNGGPGKDRVNGLDGSRDLIACGPGRDKVVADKMDRVRGCERE